MMTETEWAWLAGFIDGEGTIAIYQNGPRMVIANTDLETLEWIQASTGFGYIQENTKREMATKPCYLLSFGSHAIRAMLPKLIPHLRCTRSKAEDLLAYMSLLTRNSDPDRIRRREQAYESFRAKHMNEKGK